MICWSEMVILMWFWLVFVYNIGFDFNFEGFIWILFGFFFELLVGEVCRFNWVWVLYILVYLYLEKYEICWYEFSLILLIYGFFIKVLVWYEFIGDFG